MLRYLALLLLVACADPTKRLAIERVVPDHADVDIAQPVTIDGTFHVLTTNLDNGDTTATPVVASVDTMPLADVTWLTGDQISATMPGLPEGTYDVTVSAGDRTATLANAYTVGTPAGSDAGMDAGMDGTTMVTGTHQITVAGTVTGGPHADFPLLVKLTDPRLRTVTSGGEVANADGSDIYFSADQAGTMHLSDELERYDGTNGVVVAWVKIPSLAANTTFYIHSNMSMPANTPADVWSNAFVAVWHLGSFTDSRNAITGTPTAVTMAGGKIEQAGTFDGSTSMITMPLTATLDNVFMGGGTADAWIFPATAGEAGLGKVFEKDNLLLLGMCNAFVVNSVLFGRLFSTAGGNWCSASGSVPLNAWSYVTVVYDDSSAANTPKIYVNGVATAVSPVTQLPSGSRTAETVPLVVGNRAGADRTFDGTIDELHLAHAARSAGWIKTTFDDQSNPSGFVQLGP